MLIITLLRIKNGNAEIFTIIESWIYICESSVFSLCLLRSILYKYILYIFVILEEFSYLRKIDRWPKSTFAHDRERQCCLYTP